MSGSLPVAIYYEHPEWFCPLFAELDRRGFAYTRVDASQHSYDPNAGKASMRSSSTA